MKESAGRIVQELRSSAKYGFLNERTLKRAADYGLRREKKMAGALKAAKAKLHQVYGAYLAGGGLERAAALVRSLPERMDGDAFRETCRKLMGCHVSSAERLEFVGEFYGAIFSGLAGPIKVLDLCCGFHPLGIPWMPLGADSEYIAWDTDARMTELLADCFERSSSGPRFSVQARDIGDLPDQQPADLVFLLKTLPSLERQERGLGRSILSRLRARRVAVSFPARSLSGRERGMRENYEGIWAPVFRDLGFDFKKIEYPPETLYLLKSA